MDDIPGQLFIFPAVGVLVVAGMGLVYWLRRPPAAAIAPIEAFFADRGTVMRITRLPFGGPTGDRMGSFRVEVMSSMGMAMPFMVDVSPDGEVTLIG
jgi:hypothetical protein